MCQITEQKNRSCFSSTCESNVLLYISMVQIEKGSKLEKVLEQKEREWRERKQEEKRMYML